jgi:hypothetical protein
MEIKSFKINELIEYARNPRKNDAVVDRMVSCIKEFGFRIPIVAKSDGSVVDGHLRLKAAKKLGMTEVPVVIADDLTDAQIKAFRLIANQSANWAEWDEELLKLEFEDLKNLNFDLDLTGFGLDEIERLFEENVAKAYSRERSGALFEQFGIPPFSVLSAMSGAWQERKRKYKEFIDSREGRDEDLLPGFNNIAKGMGMTSLSGTSEFDPVLCEILLRWFCPAGGCVLDPFAGGSVRGLVSVLVGNDYTGVDLRSEQIEANEKNYLSISKMQDFSGNKIKKPDWICGDSAEIKKLVNGKYDFMLTCPPYGDLEKYSDDPKDLSNMPYEKFIEAYGKILKDSVDLLKDNAFIAIVVGEIRDKKGYYRNFVADTISAMLSADTKYYNECILVCSVGSLALRIGRQFSASRKIEKQHQNVLIFVKGNEKKIELTPYDYDFSEIANDEDEDE